MAHLDGSSTRFRSVMPVKFKTITIWPIRRLSSRHPWIRRLDIRTTGAWWGNRYGTLGVRAHMRTCSPCGIAQWTSASKLAECRMRRQHAISTATHQGGAKTRCAAHYK